MATSLDSLIKCPEGTKFWILHLGWLEADEAWFKRGANASTASNPNPQNERRRLIQYSLLIEHPEEGLILWETGSGKDHPKAWGAPLNDIFAQIDYDEGQDLDKQVERTGHKMSDIKMVIMGHLHLDHAGGLEHFKGTGVPIVVHELELKNAFYSVATGFDLGVYLPQYLDFSLNWTPWTGSTYDVAQGITLRHMPGHTPGLAIIQMNLENSGTWIATTDMYLVKENWEENHPQGFLARDHNPWCHSNQQIHQLQRRTKAKMMFGHCDETMKQYEVAPHAYD